MAFRLRRRRAAAAFGPTPAPARAAILGPYTRAGFWHRHRRLGLTLIGLIAFLYGFFFALTTTFFLLQLAVPLIVLALMIVWVLPETGKAPTGLLNKLFFAFLVALLCWPDYLALALPGLPWITAIRLVAVPLATVFLLALSQSRAFRAELTEILAGAPLVWKLLAIFSVIALLSVGVSSDPAQSVSKFVVAMLYWVLIFFVACWVFTRRGRATAFGYLIWFVAIYVCLIGIQEARHSAIPWADNIPSFLKIEDESVQRILSGKSRAATGIYRVQSKFTTPLGLAEFLAYATPFILHFAVTGRRIWERLGALLTIPLVFHTINATDSRLGMVGFFTTFLLYLLAWGVYRWRRDGASLFGPLTVIGYPVVVVSFFAASLLVGRLRAMLWGDGSQQFSDQSRKLQFASGVPKVFNRPWGHGIGQGAETLGFTNSAGVLTIDTYFLLVALEFGVIGFAVYYTMFGTAAWQAAKASMRQVDRDTGFLVPLAIALTNFIIIKSIFSQQENHPLIFAMLGAVVALLYRMDRHDPRVREAVSLARPA